MSSTRAKGTQGPEKRLLAHQSHFSQLAMLADALTRQAFNEDLGLGVVSFLNPIGQWLRAPRTVAQYLVSHQPLHHFVSEHNARGIH